MLLTAAALGVAAAASAQGPGQTDDAALARRPDLVIACEPRDGLSLCVQPFKRREKKPADRVAKATGTFGKFTRLAGMFMGRVDAAELGDFRFRFVLDLR